MTKRQILKEKEAIIKRKIALFLTAAIVTLGVIVGDSIIENGDVMMEAAAYTKERSITDARFEGDYIAPPEPEPEPESVKEMTIEEKISAACADYGISDDIPLAIAKLETGHFTSNAYINYNNPGGMSINEVPITYATIEEGVDAFVGNLAKNYFGIGLTTPESIAQKYCPINAENWAEVVRGLM